MHSKITYSAPAKVILSGEHSGVHFEPALVTSCNLRLFFTISDSNKKINPKNTDGSALKISSIVREYLNKKGIEFDKTKKYEIRIDSSIPQKQGFGSSAAFSVAGAAAFLEFYGGKEFSKEEINEVAYEMEKVFHGNPSGMDNSASCFGGLVYFRKEFEFLKTVSTLPFEIPKGWQDNFYLIFSGNRKETTADLVGHVGNLLAEDPARFKKVLRHIGKTTKQIVTSMHEKSEDYFLSSIARNQKLLEKLEVVSDKTKKILKELTDYGTGKIVGAGGIEDGSGYLLFYAKNRHKNLEKYLQDHKIAYLKLIPGSVGVKREVEEDKLEENQEPRVESKVQD